MSEAPAVTTAPSATLGFVKLVVRDLDAMLDFYGRALGLVETQTVDTETMTEKILGKRGAAGGASLILYRHKDGREIPIEISLSPLETEDGMVVTSAISDISDRKRSEEGLRLLSGQLLRLQDEERRRIAREHRWHYEAGNESSDGATDTR